MRMQDRGAPFRYVGDVEVKGLLWPLLTDRNLSLRSTGDVHWLSVNVGHRLLGSQFGLLVAMLVVRLLSLKTAEAAPFGGGEGRTREDPVDAYAGQHRGGIGEDVQL